MSFRWPEIKLPGSTKRRPEDSVELRAWVLAAVLVGEAAVLTSGYFGTVTSVLVPFLTVVAFVVSYQRRRERNILIKVMLAFGALAALAMFFREVLSSLYDTRVPLARLFLWVQVIHAFDLPTRKDLSYSLISALILAAVGAVLSTSLWYGIFVLAFLLCAMGAMTQMNLSEARERAGLQASRSRGLVVGTVVPCFFAVVAVGLVCFSLLPQRQAMNLTMMPTSALRDIAENFTGDVQNPYYGAQSNPFAGPPMSISPNSYHGFLPYMDLRSRGRLSDEVVMKVRSEESVPYRGVVFDDYNGKGWEISTGDTAQKLTSHNLRFDTFTATNTEPGQGPVREVSQVFYVEKDSSNIIFGAYRPETIFFPTSTIKIDPYASLRAPYQIPEGSAYSVISSVPNASPDQLRSAGTAYPVEIADRYTQLPPTGLERTRALAGRLTEGTTNPYDAVLRMNQYLKETYPYDLSIPPQMEEMDAVEYFLFEQKRGYCEQFSSSLAVMARSLGIPARVATGYAPGEYNPFTGYHDVRASDAHAWVEVYFPGYGWSTFDPTPSFDSTPWQYRAADNLQGGKVFGFMAKRLGEAAGPAAATAGTLVRGVARLDPASIIIVGLLVGGAYLAFFYTRKFITYRRRETLVVRPIKVSDARLYSRYKKITTALEGIGIVREPQETPEQYARRAARNLDEPGMNRLGEIYLYARFRDAVPSTLVEEFDSLEPRALAAIERLQEAQTARSG
jgi:protein-glutamine gamma-glutamyltransferase